MPGTIPLTRPRRISQLVHPQNVPSRLTTGPQEQHVSPRNGEVSETSSQLPTTVRQRPRRLSQLLNPHNVAPQVTAGIQEQQAVVSHEDLVSQLLASAARRRSNIQAHTRQQAPHDQLVIDASHANDAPQEQSVAPAVANVERAPRAPEPRRAASRSDAHHQDIPSLAEAESSRSRLSPVREDQTGNAEVKTSESPQPQARRRPGRRSRAQGHQAEAGPSQATIVAKEETPAPQQAPPAPRRSARVAGRSNAEATAGQSQVPAAGPTRQPKKPTRKKRS
ncbi:hypothetical protein CONPUDRAFT_84106 [Coniophora puteana RWD-64-598 SS2]|uniref:Uncharacterized protein n=1 Tax=Coniophora puteana (strain RWD-64-598) TaxID=741705 RepID=A0A5M3MGI1_CONPW|nr:uncharacterized protein CONPUDRAFT_84106 [Coniophora puteana RWD-64-598 SS2]EIW77711.1 hypothetical protein CONPUDRAFT_84106 [Coniophora puteana RWD-64-598 SS2]